MIKLEKVTKKYGDDAPALDSLDLTIESGEFLSIVGQSGAGKSTLVRLLIAEERPTDGTIVIDDWQVDSILPNNIPFFRRQIGVVFQDFKLLPNKTVSENTSFALEVQGMPDNKITIEVERVLEMVGLSGKALAFPEQLSGGEQQRVAIARALVHQPKILIADEPTGNLDLLNSWEIMQLLLRINEIGTTVIMVTHNADVVNELRKRVVTLDQGKIVRNQKVGRYKL
ncbi:cell division ATP-binding protein FtsE [Patescibacteria group bacterium]